LWSLGRLLNKFFVAEKWYRNARKQAVAEALTRADVEKSLGAARQEQIELSKKLKVVDQVRLSFEASLKIAER